MVVLPEIRKAYSFSGISSLETTENEYLQKHNQNKLKNSAYKLCYIGCWTLLLYVIKFRLSPFHMNQ